MFREALNYYFIFMSFFEIVFGGILNSALLSFGQNKNLKFPMKPIVLREGNRQFIVLFCLRKLLLDRTTRKILLSTRARNSSAWWANSSDPWQNSCPPELTF